MDILIVSLFFSAILLALALAANKWRRTHSLSFDLIPNCLLTRWPIIFISGKRSLFYFNNYWNIYPVFLAEHGYEVFKLNLPWKNTVHRQDYFKRFFKSHTCPAHLMMDQESHSEFLDLVKEFPQIKSCTIIDQLPFTSTHTSSTLVAQGIYWLHVKLSATRKAPGLNALGAESATALRNSLVLLDRVKQLAEKDVQN